uniref:protein FAR1-RELATED SEQUENCE 5-like n=1 Tax=Erigeron canadensis TaxID=72917 RepID=UPI001CB931AB|nr:protein FAR1-RELATED SEQUENCE 5-like [Erigeron canadensis]
MLSDKNNYEGEHTLIDEIDNNFYLVQDGEEKESMSFSNESANRYSFIGRIFDNLDVAYDFYNEYGLSRGFGIRRNQSYKHKVTNIVYTSIFVCNKQGYKNMNDKRRLRDDIQRRCITRTGCMAMIQVTCRSHSIFHRSKECKDVVTLLSNSGIKPSDITKAVNALRGSEKDRLTRVQCSNIVTNERKINLGKECHGIIMHFQEKAELDQEFYFAMELSTDGTLRNVFWADGRSRSSFCQFGDVVVFDTTYRTNKFNLPFAPFVGVNHHGKSILFGAALLENETETSFIWLFKQFLKCMHECPPVSIITDQDLAMGKAIAKVFPKTRHRFCAWHIQKHILEHLQPLQSRYDDFEETFNRWLKSQNVEDFEAKWVEVKNKYDIADDSWLGNMYSLRHQWVKSYLKDTFFAGMTSSGRCESMHSFFDGYVNSKTMLNEFV